MGQTWPILSLCSHPLLEEQTCITFLLREKPQIPVSCKYIQIIAGSAVRRFCFALALLPLSQVGCESALGDAAAGREALYVHVWQREATARAGFEGL